MIAVIFFIYIRATDVPKSDVFVVFLVISIWTLGGYVNTTANIMAPSVVDPSLVPRASVRS